MKYMFLIHRDESQLSPPGTPEFLEGVAAFDAFHQSLIDEGIEWEGAPLQLTQTATSVRVRDDKALVTDGPFAEVKEQLGGFYVIDLDNIDKAIEIAGRIPWAQIGTVEIRPLASIDRPQDAVPGA